MKYGDLFRIKRDPLRTAAAGEQVEDAPEYQYITVDEFRGGYDSSTVAEKVKAGSSPYMVDLEVDLRGRLTRLAGIAVLEQLDRVPVAMFAHPTLTDTIDVVLISGSYMGVRAAGSTTWYNVGLPTGLSSWVASLHGDVLVFSNNEPGSDIYAREAGATTVSALGWGEAGSLVSFAGRIFAFNPNIGGVRNPLGVKWTGASGFHTDISGPGSGYELLLDDISQNDRIVAARGLGFDMLVVLLRKSIWVGTPTGDAYRPVDFRPRVPGVGAVAEATVRSVQGGVIFLSDAGVKLFNGQTAEHISGPIDSDLLPIDYTNISRYSATYNPQQQIYTLHTPNETWIYERLYNRWFRSSLVCRQSLSLYNPVIEDYNVSAGWGEYWSGFWSNSPPSGIISLYDDMIYLKNDQLGRPDPEAFTYFGVPQTPVWTSARADALQMPNLVSMSRIDLEYETGGEFSIYCMDANGEYTKLFKNKTLDTSSGRRQAKLHNSQVTTYGVGVQVNWGQESMLKVRRLGASFIMRGQRNTP